MTDIPIPAVLDVPSPSLPVTVIGDVHLTQEEPDVARRFVAFLSEIAKHGGTLVLLGDIFDWWVGRPQAEHDPFARQVVDALKAVASRGVHLTFLAGNRDYSFDGVEGLPIDIWPDVVRTRWGEKTVVLTHGDLLCSADRSYLRMRAWLRSKPGRLLLHSLPYRANAYCARGLRDLSERATRRKAGAMMGLDYDLAARWLEAFEADALVVGHVHTGVHHRLEGVPPRDVYVLRDWSRVGNAVRFDGGLITLARA